MFDAQLLLMVKVTFWNVENRFAAAKNFL